MESSEDDAGAATNASRRDSAREKDIEETHKAGESNNSQQLQFEAETPSETNTMSEDNFDGDSVPSPSAQDVNTSTEAILDMIDEFVDGPDAPKRLPLLQESVESQGESSKVSEIHVEVQANPIPIVPPVNTIEPPCSPRSPPVESAAQENLLDTRPVESVASSSLKASQDASNEVCDESTPASSILSESDLPKTPQLSLEAEPLRDCALPNIPSSSVVDIVQEDSEVSECQEHERTVKCVTSSDSQDNVTTENVESTSSDNSVSEGTLVSEPVTRSPLKRRLIRPTPCDRRPDSTVSSTVDSQSVVETPEQSSDSITKDVSSSSDTVPHVHGNNKTEEIRNVSDTSICQAETSRSPPKKIKLIRQKITPPIVHRAEVADSRSIQPDDQCQSTSTNSNKLLSALLETNIESTSCVSTSKSPVTVEPVADNNVPLPAPEQPKVEEPIVKPDCQINEISETSQCESKPPEISCSSEIGPEDIKANEVEQKVLPQNLNLENASTSDTHQSDNKEQQVTSDKPLDESEPKSVPKLTIKLSNKQPQEMKAPIPKLTIKTLKPPLESENIEGDKMPSITKLNIKRMPKVPEKINDSHRKSSSSEISESEYSENDETSTSDQASTSDHGTTDIVPKVTIKLGKPGTDSEGKFYTEPNIPKLTIKGLQHNDEESTLKLVISQPEDKLSEKVPKLTIKTISKTEGQPLSPKLTIKPLKPPDNVADSVDHILQLKTQQIPKLKISQENIPSSSSLKENVPKITIKPITRSDSDTTSKKSVSDSSEHIPVVTKLNIKPILKPEENDEISEDLVDKVPVISKLNIKPVVKPKEDIDSSVDDIPRITKLNIKPIRNPEECSSETKDCDVLKADTEANSIPVVTKLNIKPIVKPMSEQDLKDSENQSSETGNSSDENVDHIPVVTKLNIKPIVKPDKEHIEKFNMSNEESIPVITKLNIKPVIKQEVLSPQSPKREGFVKLNIKPVIRQDEASPQSPKKDSKNSGIPIVTKLNIKPVVKPDNVCEEQQKPINKIEDVKNPPLVMKINMKSVIENAVNETHSPDRKVNHVEEQSIHNACNNIDDSIPIVTKLNIKPIAKPSDLDENAENCEKLTPIQNEENHEPVSTILSVNLMTNSTTDSAETITKNKLPSKVNAEVKKEDSTKVMLESVVQEKPEAIESNTDTGDITNEKAVISLASNINENVKHSDTLVKQHISPKHNCVMLKRLLESKKEINDIAFEEKPETNYIAAIKSKDETSKTDSSSSEIKIQATDQVKVEMEPCEEHKVIPKLLEASTYCSESITKPLEIKISDKSTNQGSGQDSPRIILKINKTEHGPSAKIITEEIKRPENHEDEKSCEIQDDTESVKKNLILNSKKKEIEVVSSAPVGKRLRSSRIVESPTITNTTKKSFGKRTNTETSPNQPKDSDLTDLESKRLKLGQLLSNKNLTVAPVKKSPENLVITPIPNHTGKKNHTLLNNDNCSKNGNSKLHSILSNLQAKQKQALNLNAVNSTENASITAQIDTSTSSLECVEVPVENCHPQVQEMIINENSDANDSTLDNSDLGQDPLEVDSSKVTPEDSPVVPKLMDMTPQPKKRGRPRKLPVSEGAKPLPESKIITLPVTALEERPQRSLRLSRDRPAIIPRRRGGRGRGRGGRRPASPTPEPVVEIDQNIFPDEPKSEEIDPTSSRIKLPRMTEALDKLPSSLTSGCSTPLSSRRRNSSINELFETQELKVVLEAPPEELMMRSPESVSGKGSRGGRGARGGRGRAPVRTPRARGRGRGGGRGAMYMKETLGIYGRVCGPATTTVQLFEEETCMMDDNATTAKLSSHILDEDSQNSVKSSTNESSKVKKSKFADLFDSNKVWVAADVKEYTWPSPSKTESESQVMMIQEQVAMFLGVKSFKRRYPELKRRTIGGEERDYVLSKGLVTEALCDLGITAVDASEVLDIMLSDYPHKYEEYRAYQRAKQIADASSEETTQDTKPEERLDKVEMKIETKSESSKPEPPKVDPIKARKEMAAAAIASASEFNARLNSQRRPACVDLQTMTVQRRTRAPQPPRAPPEHVRPPGGYYPHALLPGQYQHYYRRYTPQQLRYFPLNTVLAAPPAPPSPAVSSDESEPDWPDTDSDDSQDTRHPAKRKKLTKTKRSSQADTSAIKKDKEEEKEGEVDLCRVCKLRLEANRKYTHERFLVCAHCNAKLHPGCVELNADTIRKCREYAWQCADCKTCGACQRPADDDKMLFCDLCDRGFHIYCVGLSAVPSGRWHCVECAVCKSCGAREPSGSASGGASAGGSSSGGGASAGGSSSGGGASAAECEWHHQTKRGPGGHKVYSHSLCTPCARAYRIGRYCPLCDRSFIGPKGTMQLVICKLCDRQLHQDCVKQTVSCLNVLDYTCAECRRGGITSRAAAVRVAPRTIATLFMAKRRFNKYAHRQYMQSRRQDLAKVSLEDSREPVVDADASDGDASDPLEGVGDETAAAVDSLTMDFGD